MGFIQDMLRKRKERDMKLKAYEDDDFIVNNVGQRKLSHNERVLIKSLEEERQECIKETLLWDAKKRKAEDLLKTRNFMKFNPEHFNQDTILNQKNMFLKGGNF